MMSACGGSGLRTIGATSAFFLKVGNRFFAGPDEEPEGPAEDDDDPAADGIGASLGLVDPVIADFFGLADMEYSRKEVSNRLVRLQNRRAAQKRTNKYERRCVVAGFQKEEV